MPHRLPALESIANLLPRLNDLLICTTVSKLLLPDLFPALSPRYVLLIHPTPKHSLLALRCHICLSCILRHWASSTASCFGCIRRVDLIVQSLNCRALPHQQVRKESSWTFATLGRRHYGRNFGSLCSFATSAKEASTAIAGRSACSVWRLAHYCSDRRCLESD